MSGNIFQPIGQVKLTNVAVVRLKEKGKRFEVACYRNKILDYRNGLERNLAEVLQTDRIFTNVSKGQFANSKDLKKAFGTTNEEEIAKVILQKGSSLQVSDLERSKQLQNTLSQIATWVSNNCVHPDSQRPYTVSQIKHSLAQYNVQPHKALKKQYLDAVKFLKVEIPIERARMELILQYVEAQGDAVDAALDKIPHKLVSEKKRRDPHSITLQVDPSLYRDLNELAARVSGKLEIVQQVVSQEGDVDLEAEISRKKTQRVEDTTNLNAQKSHVESEEAEEIVMRLQQVLEPDDEEIDESEDSEPQQLSRKAHRLKQKKAKKLAKRKEAESVNGRDEEPKASAEERPAERSTAASQSMDGAKTCNTCGGGFLSTADYRAHFRSDWHRFNMKLKIKGVAPVSEEEFKLCDEETFFGMSE